MKQRDLIKKLENAGFYYVRTGKHLVYKRNDDEIEEIPRHREINDLLARAILKKWNIS